ncbi:hypothetical protein [Streptomyces sp. G-G2]|uniref:hypothetical protein n=1 Tax=Streptomyces sp. G-G2 TaxID=3046201 RepID=UPI0024BAE3A2|nr:hypothetical protein [Streptomyces sp. G-G2]MDJ0386129.1 hypothetical protein [Streptomyces sp. G-G2]
MGAITFFDTAAGDDPVKAFATVRDEARYEHGHREGTGSIAEKDSFTVIDEVRRSEAAAHRRAAQLIDSGDPRIDNKWGPAGALPITTANAENGWLFFGWAND